MPRSLRRDPMFRYRRHEDEIIVLAVRWYISYRLSLRDLTEMLDERGLAIYPSTIWRWVQPYVPEFEKRWDTHGGATKRTCRFEANGFTSTAPLTGKAERLTSCCARRLGTCPSSVTFRGPCP